MVQTFHGMDAIVTIGDDAGNDLCATRGLTISIAIETVDTTTRCNKEHRTTTHMASWITWTGSTDGLFVAPSTSLQTLQNAAMKGEELPLKVTIPGAVTYAGKVILTSFDLESPHDDAVAFSSDLQGSGELDITYLNPTSQQSELKTGLDMLLKEAK